jgi:hypothetical protein
MLLPDMTSVNTLMAPTFSSRMVWPATSWSPVLTRA